MSAGEIQFEFDPRDLMQREFTELEQQNLPFVAMQTINQVAYAIRKQWVQSIAVDFNQPIALTRRSPLFTKATKTSLSAQVFIRDEVFKGTPPSRYLKAQVFGGGRRHTRLEGALNARGVLPAGMFVVPGKGLELNAAGNVPRGVVQSVLAQVRGNRDSYSDQSARSRKRRQNRERKRLGYTTDTFVLRRPEGRKPAGIYRRVQLKGASVLHSLFLFVKSVVYRQRFDAFGDAGKVVQSRIEEEFAQQLQRALASSKYRGGR